MPCAEQQRARRTQCKSRKWPIGKVSALPYVWLKVGLGVAIKLALGLFIWRLAGSWITVSPFKAVVIGLTFRGHLRSFWSALVLKNNNPFSWLKEYWRRNSARLHLGVFPQRWRFCQLRSPGPRGYRPGYHAGFAFKTRRFVPVARWFVFRSVGLERAICRSGIRQSNCPSHWLPRQLGARDCRTGFECPLERIVLRRVIQWNLAERVELASCWASGI